MVEGHQGERGYGRLTRTGGPKDRFHAPIEYDRETNGYRFGAPGIGPRYELPGLWLSAEEIRALLTMQQLLDNLQPALLAPHVKPLLARLSAILGSGDHSHDEVAKRVRVLGQAERHVPARPCDCAATLPRHGTTLADR